MPGFVILTTAGFLQLVWFATKSGYAVLVYPSLLLLGDLMGTFINRVHES
jgi:hypothetical protein